MSKRPKYAESSSLAIFLLLLIPRQDGTGSSLDGRDVIPFRTGDVWTVLRCDEGSLECVREGRRAMLPANACAVVGEATSEGN